LAVIFVAGVFAVYSPALNFQFILDDHHFLNDPRLQSPGHVWEYFTTYVWAQTAGAPASFFRPVFILWLRLNFILCAMSPWGWHLLSTAKHVAVAILLGLLVWKLLRDHVAVLLSAGLFALHPAQTESVAWVTVPDPLMAAAMLGCLLLCLKSTDGFGVEATGGKTAAGKTARKSRGGSQSKLSPRLWLTAAAMACLAGLMAKETAIVLPVMICALAFINMLGDSQTVRLQTRVLHSLKQTTPFFLATLFYLIIRSKALGGRLSTATQHLSWSTVMMSWPSTLWFYLKVLLWPVHSYAFADSIPATTLSFRGVFLPALEVACALALTATLGLWIWHRAQSLPPREASGVRYALLIALLLLVLPILPALYLNALNPGDFLHGRYTYLPSAGMALLLATAWHLAETWRPSLLLAASSLIIAFTVLTLKQEMAWRDDLTVFTVAHQIAPRNQPVALNLARTRVQAALDLDQSGRCDEALPMFEQVTQQYPQDWFAWAGLGDCQVQLNDLPKAEQSLSRAAELSHDPRVKEQWQQVRDKLRKTTALPR
jgi:hypothetical protein